MLVGLYNKFDRTGHSIKVAETPHARLQEGKEEAMETNEVAGDIAHDSVDARDLDIFPFVLMMSE